jgi:putative RNA 2'-phosphotransferase
VKNKILGGAEMSEDFKNLSKYLCFVLRHHPEEIGEPHEVMDVHGWVDVNKLIGAINDKRKYPLSLSLLEKIVAEDNKERYRFNQDKSKIKCCQGHSIEWIEPELTYKQPPEFLYHGTTTDAMKKILASGYISKMKRHAVHMQADIEKARLSAERWHLTPVILKISALELYNNGVQFGVTENEVWCAEEIPSDAIVECIY